MKKILFALFLLTSFSFLSKLNAQNCTITTPVISNIRVTSGATCSATFDLEYDITSNSGSKLTGIYIYSGSLPATFFSGGSNIPVTSTVNSTPNVLATIQIDPSVAGSTSITYQAKGSSGNPTSFKPNLPYTTTTNADGSQRTKILNITVPISCSGTVDLSAAIGNTNQGSFSDYQCLNTISFRVNDPILRGQMTCSNPRSFTFAANTINATQITFSAYSDAARTVLLQAPAGGFVYSGYGTTAPITITSYSNITLNTDANSNLSFGPFNYQSANGTKNDVYLSVSVTGNTKNTNSLQIENSCAALPVTFTSFNAARSNDKVNLTWETSSEVNNRGFNVQRNVNGVWKNVGFVFSRAENGNSGSTLSYSFPEVNTEKGISQYRIEQVDMDGRAKYTDIRSVRGLGEVSTKMSLFPNPTANGKVNLLFENTVSKRDVIVSDISGRIVKQIKGVVSNSLVIDNLSEGVYSVQVTDLINAQTTVQKLVVTKR
ncbi:MAG: T9SS type A sorting domain-containing protein [Chitinophagaceae bacterium]